MAGVMKDDELILQEVALRDGLQIEGAWVETSRKIEIADRIASAGIRRIEATSFVSPQAIPALRDAEAVFAGLKRRPGTIYSALVPNLRGAERAIRAGVEELNLVASASDTHNRANMRRSTDRSLADFAVIAGMVRDAAPAVQLNGSIATAFGCPFEGRLKRGRTLDIVEAYLAMGIDSITLADTTGMANPMQVRDLVRTVLGIVPASHLTLHFHDTRGVGMANVVAAYEAGARRFDASLGGLGGCPFAPGASGNVCSEDLVNMCDDMGIPTGIDLTALISIARDLARLVGHDLPGQVMKAGPTLQLHPCPAAQVSPSLDDRG